MHPSLNTAPPHCTRRAYGRKLSAQCKREVIRTMLEVADDWRLDPTLQTACQDAVDTLCEDVDPGQGRELTCLVRLRPTVGRDGAAWHGRGEIGWCVACMQSGWRVLGLQLHRTAACLTHKAAGLSSDAHTPKPQPRAPTYHPR